MRLSIILTLMSLFITFLTDLQGYEGKRWDRRGLQEYAKDVQKRKGWVQRSEGFFNGKLEKVSVRFESYQMVEFDEARKLFVPEVRKAIAMLQNKQKKSILATNGPFGPTNLTFSLTLNRPDDEYYPPPFITMVIFANEKISYHTRNANGKGFCEICEESFEEAIEILNREASQTEMLTDTSAEHK
ncbi:MAG: hypothetical protein Q8K75_09580 [Chlamydiales bacterium]|nr:hypothetical protein [Chlamydiales bacterium]